MIAPAERVRAMTAAGAWRNETLAACLDRWARKRPDALAAVDGERRYTWAALAGAVERAAHGLAAHGVEPGAVVSVQLPNWNEFVVIALAAERLGAVRDRYHCLALDLRGHGDSEWSPEMDDALEAHAGDVEASWSAFNSTHSRSSACRSEAWPRSRTPVATPRGSARSR